MEALLGLSQAGRFEAVQVLCSTLDDANVERIIAQLFSSLAQPSALLATQLLIGSADALGQEIKTSGLDAEHTRSLIELLSPTVVDAETQLPVAQGEGDGPGGELLPFEEDLLNERPQVSMLRATPREQAASPVKEAPPVKKCDGSAAASETPSRRESAAATSSLLLLLELDISLSS